MKRPPLIAALLALLLAGCASTLSRPFPLPTPGWEGAARLELVWRYRVTADEDTRKVRFIALLPRTMPRRQAVTDLAFDPAPTKVYERGPDRYAEYVLVKPRPETLLTVRVFVELVRPDLASAARREAIFEPEEPGGTTSPEEHIESDDPRIAAAAGNVAGGDPVRIVRGLLAWESAHMSYGGFQSEELGASGAFTARRGDCTDYADLFVALCRARGIPARVAKGIVTEFGDDTSKHSWAEAWLGPLGWVAFDPLWVDLGKATADTLKAVYLTLSYKRTDPELDGYHDWVYWYWGGKAKVEETLDVLHPNAGGEPLRLRIAAQGTCASPTAEGSASSSWSGAGSAARSTLPSPACGR